MVESGIDDNRNAILDDDEVDELLLQDCRQLFDLIGDVEVSTQLELLSLRDVRSISGKLSITGPSIRILDLVSLETIQDLDVSHATSIVEINLPSLLSLNRLSTREGGQGLPLVSVAQALRHIRLPSVVSVGSIQIGSVFDEETIALETLDLSSLVSLTGSLTITNTQLIAVVMPQLDTAGTLNFTAARTIEEIDLGTATSIGQLIINNGSVLENVVGTEQVSSLGSLFVQSAAFDRLDFPLVLTTSLFIQSTRLPNLSGFVALASVDQFEIIGNNELLAFDLDALRSISSNITVRSNNNLPACAVENLASQLTSFTGEIQASGNNGTSDCR